MSDRSETRAAKQAFDEAEGRRIVAGQLVGGDTRKIQARYTSSYNRWHALNEQVCLLEGELGIVERWTPGSQDYKDALVLLRERKYRIALDKLERLVVQRLFELAKLGISGIGSY